MREPIAAPKTTKYSEVEITGEMTLCSSVRAGAPSRKGRSRAWRASSLLFLHQADEDVFQRALRGVQVLEGDAASLPDP
jgi:hypothetical protein